MEEKHCQTLAYNSAKSFVDSIDWNRFNDLNFPEYDHLTDIKKIKTLMMERKIEEELENIARVKQEVPPVIPSELKIATLPHMFPLVTLSLVGCGNINKNGLCILINRYRRLKSIDLQLPEKPLDPHSIDAKLAKLAADSEKTSP